MQWLGQLQRSYFVLSGFISWNFLFEFYFGVGGVGGEGWDIDNLETEFSFIVQIATSYIW